VTYGVITKLALAVAQALESRGRSTSVVTVSTLRPLDRTGLIDILSSHSSVSVIEECVSRALGIEVEAMAHRAGFAGKVSTFSLKDEFIHCYGGHDDVLAAHGLTCDVITDEILGS